mgnify:CR=1 FL=1
MDCKKVADKGMGPIDQTKSFIGRTPIFIKMRF